MMSLSTVVSVHLPKLTHGSSFAISRTDRVGLSKSIIEVSFFFFNGGSFFVLDGNCSFRLGTGFLTLKSIGGADLISFLIFDIRSAFSL